MAEIIANAICMLVSRACFSGATIIAPLRAVQDVKERGARWLATLPPPVIAHRHESSQHARQITRRVHLISAPGATPASHVEHVCN